MGRKRFALELLNRMKWKPMGRAATASILSLAIALGVTACSNDYTVSYVYLTTEKTLPHGLINGYQVDYQSGYLRPLADSPIDAGGRDTVGMVVAPNNLFLYTVNNFDSDVVEFAIGTDGKLYPQNTYNIAGSLPTAAAIDAAGKFLYVTFTYQNTATGAELYTTANPGPGGVSIFPINPDNSLGTPLPSQPVGRNPVGIVTSPVGNFVYVIEQDAASTGNLIGFSENPATGALTLLPNLPGQTINPGNVPSNGFPSGASPGGTSPSGIIEDSTGSHLYIADNIANQITVYSVGSSGVPTAVSGTARTEAGPMGMAFDLTHTYLYVVNYTANTIDTFSVTSGGQLTRLSSAAVGNGPTCVTISGAPSNADPSHAVYLYTSNQLSNNITAEQLDPQNGSLEQIQGTPFGGSALPSCIVTVPAYPLR
jgi:6-phosphogluconolactonase (cycloisomerase 2 family)